MSFVLHLTNNIGPTSVGVNTFITIVLLTLITNCPLAHPLKGHRWGTGPKRCPARARRANVPPYTQHRWRTSSEMGVVPGPCHMGLLTWSLQHRRPSSDPQSRSIAGLRGGLGLGVGGWGLAVGRGVCAPVPRDGLPNCLLACLSTHAPARLPVHLLQPPLTPQPFTVRTQHLQLRGRVTAKWVQMEVKRRVDADARGRRPAGHLDSRAGLHW